MLIFAFFLTAASPSLNAEIEACETPGDYRPLTLCLAERAFERADARLNAQWAITYPYIKAHKGPKTARKLRLEQRSWIKKRDRECHAIADPTPTTQQGRNLMSCMSVMTERRTAELRRMIGRR